MDSPLEMSSLHHAGITLTIKKELMRSDDEGDSVFLDETAQNNLTIDAVITLFKNEQNLPEQIDANIREQASTNHPDAVHAASNPIKVKYFQRPKHIYLRKSSKTEKIHHRKYTGIKRRRILSSEVIEQLNATENALLNNLNVQTDLQPRQNILEAHCIEWNKDEQIQSLDVNNGLDNPTDVTDRSINQTK